MKIQHLAIIFLLIILPIDIVLGLYLDAQINTIRNQAIYDSKLVGCVYDALEVYQSNSIVDTENNIVTAKMNNIEASASTFLTSLQSAFGYSGYKATVMQEYVPAVVYTMYDGYYIYSKFNNTLSETNVFKDSTYNDGITIEGLKSYVFYSCRYRRDKNGKKDDFVITYTLDNYITIQGTIQGEYVNDSGYLIDGITEQTDGCEYDDFLFDKSGRVIGNLTNSEEYIGKEDKYDFVKINGTKYYYDNYYNTDKAVYKVNGTGCESIFHIINGNKVVQVAKTAGNESLFDKYKNAIYKNKSAYLYYKEAYEFTNRVRNQYKLGDLSSKNAVYWDENADNGAGGKGKYVAINSFGNYKIFEFKTGKYIQDSDSDFNQHRKAVIRYTVETNLRAAISGFSNFSDQLEFAMPKISEENWDIIENNACVIGFLQGLDIGTKKYNGYAVVANTTTNEYVDEDSIYIIAGNQYHNAKATDISDTIYNSSGVFKMDFERHYIKDGDMTWYYYPKRPSQDDIYSASYSSIITQTSVNNEYADIYKYMREKATGDVKKAYYIAIARERYGSYKMSHDINYDYFLKNY